MQNGINQSSALPLQGNMRFASMTALSPAVKAVEDVDATASMPAYDDAVTVDQSAMLQAKDRRALPHNELKAPQDLESELSERPSASDVPLFLSDAQSTEAQDTAPEAPDTRARRAVIRSLLEEGLSEKESAVFDEALGALSIENLMLLAEHKVQFIVRDIKDMPRKHGIRDFMQKFHLQAVDKTAKTFYNAAGGTGKPVDDMKYNEKLSYIRKMVELTGARLKSGSSDFGEWMGIDSSNLSRLKNITTLPGAFIGNKSFKGACFVPHCLKKSVIFHEAAHALDFIKTPESPAREPEKALPESRNDSSTANSMKDKGLEGHYRWFLEECRRSPSAQWSTYASAKGGVREYVAEAVRTYIEAPETLRKADEQMYLFTEAFLSKPSYPSHTFPWPASDDLF